MVKPRISLRKFLLVTQIITLPGHHDKTIKETQTNNQKVVSFCLYSVEDIKIIF